MTRTFVRLSLALSLCLAAVGQAQAETIIIVPPGGEVKVKTPLSKGPVWVRIAGVWRRLGPVQDGRQRILRKMHKTGHQIMSGRNKNWLRINKSGTATVKLGAHADAVGEPYTIRVACDVEDMQRGDKGGTLYRDARVELRVVVDFPKFLPDYFLGSGDQTACQVPNTIQVRRVTSSKPKSVRAEMQGNRLVMTGREPGEAKVTLNYWIGNEVKERFSRRMKVRVAVPPLEYVCSTAAGESKEISFSSIGKALRKALPDSDIRATKVERWEGSQIANLSFGPNGITVQAMRSKQRGVAVVAFTGKKRNHPFEAWVRFVVDTGAEPESEPTASASTGKPPAKTPPAKKAPPAEEEPAPAGDVDPKDALEVVNQFGSAIGADYQARTKIENKSGKTLKVRVKICFKGKSGQDFGIEVASGPKTIAPGKRARYKATLAGAGPVVDSFVVETEVLGEE